jgi:hypothetical protein
LLLLMFVDRNGFAGSRVLWWPVMQSPADATRLREMGLDFAPAEGDAVTELVVGDHSAPHHVIHRARGVPEPLRDLALVNEWLDSGFAGRCFTPSPLRGEGWGEVK